MSLKRIKLAKVLMIILTVGNIMFIIFFGHNCDLSQILYHIFYCAVCIYGYFYFEKKRRKALEENTIDKYIREKED